MHCSSFKYLFITGIVLNIQSFASGLTTHEGAHGQQQTAHQTLEMRTQQSEDSAAQNNNDPYAPDPSVIREPSQQQTGDEVTQNKNEQDTEQKDAKVLPNLLTALFMLNSFVALPVNQYVTGDNKHIAHTILSVAGFILSGAKVGVDIWKELKPHNFGNCFSVLLHGSALISAGIHFASLVISACLLSPNCYAPIYLDSTKDILMYVASGFVLMHLFLDSVRSNSLVKTNAD